jgi:DoxX-like protein
MITALLPPLWLIHVAVAAVWFYEGLWCKLLNGQPRQVRVVEAMPLYGPRIATNLLLLLGVVETAIAVWVLTGVAPILCAVAQTALLVTLNVCGLLWARRLIEDPGGMVVKNFAFLVLVWVSASFPGWR